ncbi:hypothetical protein ACFQ1I_46525 [Kitasatospora arboriphila]
MAGDRGHREDLGVRAALRPPPQGEPSRRPLAPRVSLHNPARRLAALSAFYAFAAAAGHIAEPPFNAATLRRRRPRCPAPRRCPWSRPPRCCVRPTTWCPGGSAAARTRSRRTGTGCWSTCCWTACGRGRRSASTWRTCTRRTRTGGCGS